MIGTGLSIQERLEGLSTHLDEDARAWAEKGHYMTGTQRGVWSTAVDDAEDRIEKLENEKGDMLAFITKISKFQLASETISLPAPVNQTEGAKVLFRLTREAREIIKAARP